MKIQDLSTLNAILNSISAIFLIIGYIRIRNQKREQHRKMMLSALGISALFLISYLIYHYYVGSVPYPHTDWTRPVYFAILIPHIILAGLMTPFILVTVMLALKAKYDTHRRFARWVFPVWLFVSVSGVIIYIMLYHL